MRKLLITGTALVLMSSTAMTAQAQEAPAELMAAYQNYAAARIELTQAASGGGDVSAQLSAAQAARAQLESVCASLGTPALAECLDTYVPADQRIPNDTQPLEALVSAESGAEAEAAPAEEPAMEEQPAEEPVAEEQAAPQPEPAPEPEMQDQPAPEEQVTEEPASEEPMAEPMPAEEQTMETQAEPEAESTMETEAEAESEMATDEAASEEPAASSDNQLNAQLLAAYEDYIAARAALREAVNAGGDFSAELEAATEAEAKLLAVCTPLGATTIGECLAYVPSEERQSGDDVPLNELLPAEGEMAGEPASEEPVVTETESGETAEPIDDENVDQEEVAPVLDSAKEEETAPADADAETSTEAEATAEEQPAAEEPPAEEQPSEPAPANDEEAQAQIKVEVNNIESVEAEEGQRVEEDSQEARRARRERAPENAEVVAEDDAGFRIVFNINNTLVIESSDRPRLTEDAEERYVELLPRGRTRETIIRPNGVKIVTIYNRNGDVLRRSRFTPDGREVILVYVSEDRQDELENWRDPGRDLPPLRLNIPADEYVLDASDADEAELVAFLDQPPVEQVREYYSINEVKRSARLRDMVRRLEVSDLTFASGSATIEPNQVNALNDLANAMKELLSRNPAETFLIEGHTDAVGSDISNLELSDRRAETVAVVLSDVFDIPPENLVTQGYGERYLKVRTEDAERLNRRVTVKRITPLVTPVASN